MRVRGSVQSPGAVRRRKAEAYTPVAATSRAQGQSGVNAAPLHVSRTAAWGQLQCVETDNTVTFDALR